MTQPSVVAAEGNASDQWMRVGEAAWQLNLSPDRVRQLADAGKLESQRTPLGRLISIASVEEYKQAEHPGPGRPRGKKIDKAPS